MTKQTNKNKPSSVFVWMSVWTWAGKTDANYQTRFWQLSWQTPAPGYKMTFNLGGFTEQTGGGGTRGDVEGEKGREWQSKPMNYSADTPLPLSSLQEIIGTIRLLALLSAPLICIQVSREIPQAFCIIAAMCRSRVRWGLSPSCVVGNKLR